MASAAELEAIPDVLIEASDSAISIDAGQLPSDASIDYSIEVGKRVVGLGWMMSDIEVAELQEDLRSRGYRNLEIRAILLYLRQS